MRPVIRWFDTLNPRTWYGALAIALIAGVLSVVAFVQNPNTSRDCQANPLRLVYQPSRLKVVQRCAQITGRVVTVSREHDGDLHIRLATDARWLDAANYRFKRGDLVVEFMPTDPYPAPKPGDQLTMTCTLIEDEGHSGWRECHPAFAAKIVGPTVSRGSAPLDRKDES